MWCRSECERDASAAGIGDCPLDLIGLAIADANDRA
jgi:hypothetical protein